MRPLDELIRQQLNSHLLGVERALSADSLLIVGEIRHGLDNAVNTAVKQLATQPDKKPHLAVILDTPGGIVEVVERMVSVIRANYPKVSFVVLDRAMSAGTVFVLSGNDIYMDDFSVLGPIDPQVEKDNRLVPALSYTLMFDRIRKMAKDGILTNADLVLVEKLDLAELHVFEQARDLTIDLIKKWLAEFKFCDWDKKETSGNTVTAQDRTNRAEEIATKLSDIIRWRSHSRGIHRSTLVEELKLQVKKLEDYPQLALDAKAGFDLIRDYMGRHNLSIFVGTKHFF